MSPGRSCQPQILSAKVHVVFSPSCHAIWVRERTQWSPLQHPFGSNHSAKRKLSTARVPLSSDSSQQTTKFHLEIEDLKRRNCHCSTVAMVNLGTSLVPRVRQCWICTTSVQDGALSSHQIAWHRTAQVLTASQHHGLHPFEQKKEASSVKKIRDGWKLLHRICLSSNW